MEMNDIWQEWLLERRFGGDQEQLRQVLSVVEPIRDRVLAGARLGAGQVLLDVGCGDGLIGFGALRMEPSCRVVFADVSQGLLDGARKLAETQGWLDRCRFVCNPAGNLTSITNQSINVVTTRSVLIYVADKHKAFNEFYRVLVSAGRLSIFEPINNYAYPEPDHLLWGHDIRPIQPIVQKVKAGYQAIQPPESDPMLNFDERDLVDFAEKAGFREVNLELNITVKESAGERSWDTLLATAFNPKLPTVNEMLQKTLTEAERAEFVAYMQPRYENETTKSRFAVAYLQAVK